MLKLAAWDRLGLDYGRMLLFCCICGAAAGAVVLATTRGVMPGDSLLLSGVFAVIGFYLASSLPRRMAGAAALAQSREAALLAVMGSATLEATQSRTKATLLLKSSEGAITSALEDASRRILLGHPAAAAVARTEKLASRSVRDVIGSIVSPARPIITEEGEEANAIALSSQLGNETKSPIFVAAAFFTPLMLFLYGLTAHVTDLAGLAELVALQMILLDVAFYFSSTGPMRKA